MERKLNSSHTFLLTVNYAGELPNPTNTQTEAESQHNSLSSLSFQSLNENYTRGIDVQQTSISGVGDVSIWEFSGRDCYYMLYDHFIGNANCIHVVLYNLADPLTVQFQQCSFWLSFLQSRIPPVEPLGENARSYKYVPKEDGQMYVQ